jgi:hypothetical protein
MRFEYRVIAQQPGFFAISLAARGGPFKTKDHQFGLEAIPLDQARRDKVTPLYFLNLMNI